MKYKLSAILLLVLLVQLFPTSVFSQAGSSSVAISLPIASDGVQDGNIVCANDTSIEGALEGLVLCTLPYDPSIHGVVSDSPAVVLESEGDPNTRPVVSTGAANVLVSSENGNIVPGDHITSSETPGVGQKATNNGYVLGVALEGYESDSGDATGLIQVAINIHPAAGLSGPRSDLIQILRQGISAPLFEPLAALRYILAALMILVSFTLGFVYFGRVAKTGIEALGRNPMASRMIQLTVLFNIAITIVIVLIGLAIAYLVLIL